MKLRLARYIKGSARINLAAKTILGLKIVEGKSHMTLPVYELIAKKLFQSEKPEHIMAHTFFVLDWNLMKRAENIVDANISHIRWENDCLIFHFAKSKGHQDGSEEFLGPWHVYSNPLKPWLCPVLSLARYLFMYPDTFHGKSPLFEGNDTYSRYAKNFSKLLYDMEKELAELGVHPSELGSHSGRKGVGTLVAAGCTVAPPIVSICLRMGWSLGAVLGRYFKRGDAGDQHCGRCASLIDPCVKEFAVSCAYFDFSHCADESEKNVLKTDIEKFLNDRLPNEANPQAKHLVWYFFAAICKHYQYLDSNLHSASTFRESPFFKNVPVRFRNAAKIAYPWNKTEDTPSFTGIPPHVTILAQNEFIKKELLELKSIIPVSIGDELNQRGIGTTEFFTARIESLIGNLRKEMQDGHDAVMKKLESDGYQELRDTLEEGMMYDVVAEESEDEDITHGNEDIDGSEGNVRDRQSGEVQEPSRKKQKVVTVGLVQNKVTPLPPNFEFPKGMTCGQLVQNWFIGDSVRKILPYRRLEAGHFTHSDKKKEDNQKSLNQKMGRFMAVVQHYAEAENVWIHENDVVTMEKVHNIWEKIEWKHIRTKYLKEASRSTTKSWISLLNEMGRSGAFREDRASCKDDEEWKLSINNDTLTATEIRNDDRSHLRPHHGDNNE
ncbi:hypothetical protein CTEN210_16333 [Chaetoceros tenuissimus]|nr:hypothetical protein CTEN210_16333 [Chaetoceros tenuissimus]